MRTTMFLILFSAFSSYAVNNYAQTKQLSVSLERAQLKKVFKEIERQSEFYFMYNDAQLDVKQQVSINATGADIYQILDKVLEGKDIDYKVIEKQIVLTPKTVKSPSVIDQQDRKVSGTVVNEEGVPLPGVNITIKGTNKGVTTDADGKFTIEIEDESVVLVFSFVGYQEKELSVEENEKINVTLESKLEKLDEVVVIGYGSSSRKLLSSSVTSVNSAQIEDAVASGIQEAIQGKSSGVQINRNSGTPGASISMNIRGKSSISAGTQPLYVVDGVPITSGDYSQISMEGQGIDAIGDLDPNDIESISILKDASASAIYGARAGNGVVLIETKSGKEGKTTISFNSYYGIQEVNNKLDMMNADEWKNYVETFDPDFVEDLDPDVNTNWQENVFRLAPVANSELSMRGGNAKTTYYLSGRYFKETGVVLGSDYDKMSGRLNLDHQITDWFKIGARVSNAYTDNDRIRGDQSINGVIPNAISKPPVYRVKDELGNYLQEGFWDNPVAIGNEVLNNASSFRNISNIFGEVDITENLSFKNQWGVDIYNLDERRFEPSIVKSASEENGVASDASTKVEKYTQQSTFSYMKTIGEHNLDVLLGYSFEKINEKWNSMSAIDFPSDELQYITSAGKVESSSSNAFEEGLQSFFGRFKYNYDNKYLFSFSLRRDGSSRFGENNKYATLPAASLAWRMGEEDFMSNLNSIDEFKVKLSYGLTGNDKIGAFRYLNLYSSGYNYNSKAGIIPTQMPNPDLKWETTHNYNFGIDLAMFEEKIMFSTDVYYNKTTDLLLNRPLPGSSGFTSVSSNVGALENKGLEISINTTNFDSDFKWTSDFNLSFNRNKILELYNDQPITEVGRGNNAAIVGEPISVFFMHESLGVDPSTGELILNDVNEDGKITEEDRKVVGNPNPDFTGGLTNSFNYRNFDMKIFLEFAYGNDIFNGTRQYAESMKFGTSDNQLATIKDRWKQPGDETYIPKHNGENNLSPLSSHYIEDGSYLRIRQVSLGYNLAESFLEKYVNSARIYFKVENLMTFTPYSGMDPEVNYSGVGTLRAGTDFFTYPQVRTYILGLSLNF
ncbi:MAG: TonB-dependent receptor [Bacteroidales bacterium]